MIASPARLAAEVGSLVSWVGTAIWTIATVSDVAFILFITSTMWIGYMLVTWEDGR